MTFLRNMLSVFLLAARRLWSNLALMLGTAVGLIVAVALTMSIPLYADGVNYRLLMKALSTQEQGRQRPPFAFMFRYVGAWHSPVEWADYEKADRFFRHECPAVIGLPQELAVRHVKTDNLRLYPGTGTGYEDPKKPMDWISLGFVSDLEQHARVVDGTFPSAAGGSGDAVEVLVYEDKANELGIQVGESFILLSSPKDVNDKPYQIPVRVAGIWRARDLDDPFWFYFPSAFETVFLTPEASFAAQVVPTIPKQPVYLALWYLVFDGRTVYSQDVPGFLGRVIVARTMAANALPNTSLDVSPADAMMSFVESSRLLTILLYVFAIPIIGLILYFIILTSRLVVQRQRNEIAVLRSRGTSAMQIIALYLVEGLILGVIAIGLGPLLGWVVAQVMGKARSFLLFVPSQALVIEISQQSLRGGLAAVVVSLIASLLPALGAAGHTIVTYKQDVARSLQRPWWQRLYLDVWLLAVPLYGYYLLRQRGTISVLGRSVSTAEADPFSNPLLFLVPTLFVFALALLFIRIFPLIMEVLARLAHYLPGVAPLLALRQLARSWGQYTGPLLLIVLTVGLACFTASMAKTLDRALFDQIYYEVGSDVRLIETGESNETSGGMGGGLMGGATGGAQGATAEPVIWYFLPVSEHLKVPGVTGAARVGTFRANVRLGGGASNGILLGIDRLDFGRVAFFRSDFARTSLGGLMNRLAADESAVLVPTSFLTEHGLQVGDMINLRVTLYQEGYDLPVVIAGVSDLFPMLYPEDGPFFVANLDFLFERMGGERPYDVLLRTSPGADTKQIVTRLEDLGLRILQVYDARAKIEQERQRPERQGILGLLSVGFLASALLTVLGFLFYSFLSFRRRFIELGILRAIGLSVGQMAAFLGLEQLALIVMGMAAGTGFGVLASRLFIPFLQVRGGPHSQTPPFAVQVAWGEILQVYAIFGAMLLCAVAGLSWLLVRMRIAQAVKLGEAI